MSESAPESSGGGSLDSAFSKRYGPLTGLQWTGVAVAGAGLYIWYRNKHAGTGSSSSSGQATAYGYTGMPYDYGPSIAAQQSEIQALQSGQATSAPSTNSTGTSSARTPHSRPAQQFTGQLVGSGYGIGSGTTAADQMVTVNGTTYTWITPGQAQQAAAAGQQFYYQPIQGRFAPTQPGTQFAQGTPLFVANR